MYFLLTWIVQLTVIYFPGFYICILNYFYIKAMKCVFCYMCFTYFPMQNYHLILCIGLVWKAIKTIEISFPLLVCLNGQWLVNYFCFRCLCPSEIMWSVLAPAVAFKLQMVSVPGQGSVRTNMDMVWNRSWSTHSCDALSHSSVAG